MTGPGINIEQIRISGGLANLDGLCQGRQFDPQNNGGLMERYVRFRDELERGIEENW